MANIDKKRFRAGFWLGLLLVVLTVLIFEVFRIVPLYSEASLKDLGARLLDNKQTNAEAEQPYNYEEINYQEFLKTTNTIVGQELGQ